MRWIIGLAIYRMLLPLLFLAAFPGWLLKMLKRGGIGTGLGERAAIYQTPPDDEPCAATHIHAVSVGETLLALKLIREWRKHDPEHRFVIATGTSTGHAVATASGVEGLRVTYAPLDFPSMIRRYLNRFEPKQIVLIEAEIWPHLLIACQRRNIPVHLVNARLSPRSAARYLNAAKWLKPLFRMLSSVSTQEADDDAIWRSLGVSPEKIHHTGSLKIDPESDPPPTWREDFATILRPFGEQRRVILAASTHPGEEPMIARAIREADPHALPVIVPRHAERRAEAKADLEKAGFTVVLRTSPTPPEINAVLLIDTTGELRDWTAHADLVVIGKSFLAIGGQNPCEAIIAGKPLVFGPHMENFQPLAGRLLINNAAFTAADENELATTIRVASDPVRTTEMTGRARRILIPHEGATRRIIRILGGEIR
jgi:3-deoxy-D-manno-octulosonic-acid transferase